MFKPLTLLFAASNFLLLLGLGGCGHSTDRGGFPCHGEAGLYSVTLDQRESQPSSIYPTCSDEQAEDIAGSYEIDFNDGELSCSAESISTMRVVRQLSVEGRGECDVEVIFEGNPTESNIEPGPAVAQVVCDSSDVVCEYTFDSSYEKLDDT